jgi:RNA polymerase sporulation-specific sigma factor
MDINELRKKIYDPAAHLTIEELKTLAKKDGLKEGVGIEERIHIAKKKLSATTYRTTPKYVRRFLNKCERDYNLYEGYSDRDLILRVQNGCETAMNELYIRHKLFIESVVIECIKNRREEYEDCLQVAKVAFWHCVKRFRFEQYTKIETFARPYIIGRIYDYLRSIKQFEALDESVLDMKYCSEHEAISRKIEIELILKKANLTPLEKRVISKRFGLEEECEQTFSEIAKSEKLSISYIHKVEKTALEKLRSVSQMIRS